MKTGIVQWFNDSKGYGFISTDTCKDVYVHYTSIVSNGFKTLSEGQAVEFELINTLKGPVASNVIPGACSVVDSEGDEECTHDERDHGICLDCEDDASDDIEACKKSRNE